MRVSVCVLSRPTAVRQAGVGSPDRAAAAWMLLGLGAGERDVCVYVCALVIHVEAC